MITEVTSNKSYWVTFPAFASCVKKPYDCDEQSDYEKDQNVWTTVDRWEKREGESLYTYRKATQLVFTWLLQQWEIPPPKNDPSWSCS
jgi:hypothetical protein